MPVRLGRPSESRRLSRPCPGRLRLPALWLVLAVVGSASGQRLEGFIQLPDSLGSGFAPDCMALSPDGHYAYVGGSGDGIIVVDVVARRRVARISAGTSTWSLTTISSGNRVFATGPESISVIDCGTNTVVHRVRVGSGGVDLCENPIAGKVYAADGYRDTLYLLDPVTGAVIGARAAAYGPMVFSPERNELYIVGGVTDSISVYDGTSDSLLRRLFVAGARAPVTLLPRLNKLYVRSSTGLSAVDCSTGTVTGTITTSGPISLACNPVTSQVYFGNGSSHGPVWLVDGVGDTVVNVVRLGDSLDAPTVRVGCCDTVSDKVYCTAYDNSPPVYKFAVLRGSDLGILAAHDATISPSPTCFDGAAGMTLCTGQGGTLIGVNSTTNSLALRVPVSIWAAFMVHSPRYDKLYAFCDDNLGSVTVVDCASGRVLAHIWLGRAPRWAAADPVTGKVYCTLYREDSIAVIDGAGDSLLYRRWSDERPNGVACARTATGSKVYVTVQHGANHLPVYDTRNDSLVRFVAVPDVPQHLLNGERNGVVYCSRFGAGMAAIDVALDSVVAYNATVPGAGLVSSLLFAQDLNKLYCAGGDDTIHVLDGKTLVTVHRLGHSRTTGGAGIAYSAWERKLYCALWNWSEVLVANALSDSVIDTLATGQDPELLQTATSGRILYLRNDLSRITAVDITGDTTLVHFQLPAQPVSSACSPTSRRVYYGSYSLAVFVDTATGLAEELSSASAGTPLGRTSVARGNAVLDVTEETDVFDASGRRRVVLPIGENRLVSLPAGVYYLRSRRGGASRRLVLIP